VLNIKKTFKPGEVIVRENTLGNSAYIIESGKVEVSKNIGSQRVVFTELDKGAIFGEMSLIDNSPRSATVTALEETTVTVLSKTNFQKFLSQHPAAQTIFKVMADRLRDTAVLVNPLRLTNFYYSLGSLIYYLAKAEGTEREDGLHINYDFLLNECCTILALEKDLVEKVIHRMVFTKLVHQDKVRNAENEEKILVIPKPALFKEFVEFLGVQSSKKPGRITREDDHLSENTYKILKTLVENLEEFKQKVGKITVSYERCLSVIQDLLDFSREETDKFIQPLFNKGLFKLAVDPVSHTRQLVCSNPERLEEKLEKQESLKTFQKMVNLLKALAPK